MKVALENINQHRGVCLKVSGHVSRANVHPEIPDNNRVMHFCHAIFMEILRRVRISG